VIQISVEKKLILDEDILNSLSTGSPILIFDDFSREGETDIFFSAENIKAEDIAFLRNYGGGMIFLASDYSACSNLGLPFYQDLYSCLSQQNENYKFLQTMLSHSLPYDSRSSFSLFINHKDTFTGITDNDRALTSQSFAKLIKNYSGSNGVNELATEFRIPGHVPVCIADSNLLKGRRGHTELIVSLLNHVGLTPVAVGCEMLSDDGNALSLTESRIWAKEQGYLFLEGRQIMERCL
tara:strand:- start:92 stop:805 length:714 start_codon:yes stop_codon:yes gene_type:complete